MLARASSRTSLLVGRKIKCHALGHETDCLQKSGRALFSLSHGIMHIMFERCISCSFTVSFNSQVLVTDRDRKINHI